eukprot:1157510-Pelagomonas_calceolata.AAC.12
MPTHLALPWHQYAHLTAVSTATTQPFSCSIATVLSRARHSRQTRPELAVQSFKKPADTEHPQFRLASMQCSKLHPCLSYILPHATQEAPPSSH